MELLKDVLAHVLADLQSPKKIGNFLLAKEWPSIAGPRISPHTKPMLGANGELTIWVDQSTLAFELRQRYQDTLLKRVQTALGEEKVKQIRFRVGQIR